MCEANAYIINNEQEKLFMESVDKLVPQDDMMLMLENIFGEKKFIKAYIKELALVDHKIILQERM
ncbi:MAG: CooT family nickel-binding protein [Bacillota bacterium]|jgi:predicted RNA-binding protein